MFKYGKGRSGKDENKAEEKEAEILDSFELMPLQKHKTHDQTADNQRDEFVHCHAALPSQ
ncbi:MAG: hypothetical protein KGY61_03585 [Desulfobacterales bacterium]|nr:hypothetical protein [Desulfobacterales bacterium]